MKGDSFPWAVERHDADGRWTPRISTWTRAAAREIKKILKVDDHPNIYRVRRWRC